jgi:uncharacterized membrane protein
MFHGFFCSSTFFLWNVQDYPNALILFLYELVTGSVFCPVDLLLK